MRVTLVSMPWAIFNRPSIQLGALKGYLKDVCADVHVDCHHPYLSAAQTIGLETYRKISENPWAGEALYSGLLFPASREQAKSLFCREMKKNKEIAGGFDRISSQLEEHLDAWISSRDFSDSKLLGFSICFSQLLPSLYAADRIKQKHPRLPILFGGSTCTPTTAASLLQTFTTVDYILTGEGEQPLAALLRHIEDQAPFPTKNVLRRTQNKQPPFTLVNSEVGKLSTLPTPDYDDYFREVANGQHAFIPEIPIEFSRGCWWNKCSFCNLNLQWCGYRFKSREKMLAELNTLRERYQCLDFFFTDNALPPGEARPFFQETARQPIDYHFFAEIRAPRSYAECTTYRKGGMRTIQVGIEALSDTLLQRMQKGTTVLDNIAAMKFSLAAGIHLEGNLILEFPGSTTAEAQETLRVLDAVLPYRPLQAAGFFLGQGSPVSSNPKEYGIRAITTHPGNRRLFPDSILRRLNLLIKGYQGDRQQQRKIWRPVRKKIGEWAAFHAGRAPGSRPCLTYRDGGSFLLLRQERPNQPVLRHRLKGLSRKIYLACEEPVSKKKLLERFKTIKEEQLHAFLDDLGTKHLVYCNETHCLALAVQQTSSTS